MMGFISYEEAANEKYYYVDGLDLTDCTTGGLSLMCTAQGAVIDETEYKDAIEFTVEDILTIYGPREPVYSQSTTHLKAPAIILTENNASQATIVWYNLLFEWWSTTEDYDEKLGGHTWPSVTRGKSTISTGYK